MACGTTCRPTSRRLSAYSTLALARPFQFIARLTVGWGGRRLWWLGGLALLVPLISNHALQTFASAQVVDVFNSPQLNWLGLITRLPVTEDYVPLLPWLGVMWWGVAAGSWLSSRRQNRLMAEIGLRAASLVRVTGFDSRK